MDEKTIQIDSIPFRFLINERTWQLNLAKSQTHVKDLRQLGPITEDRDHFVPAVVTEGEDLFAFSFTVDQYLKKWEEIQKIGRNDKLRLLRNIARFKEWLNTRITFFLHPDNLVFDDNLMPYVIYRGIRNLVPPFEMDEERFLLQYKCLIIALFSKNYSFDELYSGSLNNAKETAFERQVAEADNFESLMKILEDHYVKEQKETEEKMLLVPKKRFNLFKQLTFIFIGVSVLLAIPLSYLYFAREPYQNHLLDAHRHFLATDYEKVINDLEGEDPEKLPIAGKYILASSYLQGVHLDPEQKENIRKNMSLKSDPKYLLFWIYSGRGNVNKALDLAKSLDDPRLIVYGITQKMEQVNNDPNISGSKREEEVEKYKEQLKKYDEEYHLNLNLDSETSGSPSGQQTTEPVENNNQNEPVQKEEKKPAGDTKESKKEEKPKESKKEEKSKDKK
ncbi:type VII secretion protein EssB [Fictibacillus sp. Mic-4]|uniref:type VII secretion protein EssB n=1 Tax=Fictibacillus TaxID=1329200 RepID=UPI00041EF571|nr:type VII secretion protein EssB [Fictibacillus gelatini]